MTLRIRRFSNCVVAVVAVLTLATTARADGLARGSLKDAPAPEKPRCAYSANVDLSTEYVFRGYSQTAGGPAVQGGFDATCGMFYAGVWASNLDWGKNNLDQVVANIEMDWYAGIKPVTGRITWDLGVIYYTYPKSKDLFIGRDNNYVELKVGASTEVWKGGTAGVTVFYSPEYQYETGNVWTVETSFAQVLPKIDRFTPTFTALLGFQQGQDGFYKTAVGNGDDSYLYWNAGVTLGFLEKWSLDFRYWDTSLSDNRGGKSYCEGSIFQCDQRYLATLKFTY
jgi:uncharacterized protein (TIGR02001 family)